MKNLQSNWEEQVDTLVEFDEGEKIIDRDKLDIFSQMTLEMIEPDRFELMIVRKEYDRKDFKFEEDMTYWISEERMLKRKTFDDKHYYNNREVEIGW